MDLALNGKAALVSGGSGGLGRAMAMALAAAGCAIAVGYRSNEAQARDATDQINGQGGRAVAIRLDVADSSDVTRALQSAKAQFGDLHVLVNNAGAGARGDVADTDDDEIDRVLAINVKGVFHACREAAALLADGGRIINISSGLTNRPERGFGLYAASKRAVEALTRGLAEELGPRAITVNTVQDGATEPGMFENAPDAERQQRMQDSYFRRIGTADEFAAVVTFLAGGPAGWVSGQTLCVDGGAMS